MTPAMDEYCRRYLPNNEICSRLRGHKGICYQGENLALEANYEEERRKNAMDNLLHAITIKTHVPSKWRFLDLETDEVWKWEDGKFKPASDAIIPRDKMVSMLKAIVEGYKGSPDEKQVLPGICLVLEMLGNNELEEKKEV